MSISRLTFVVLILLAVTSERPLHAQNQFHIGQYMLHQPFINPSSAGSYEQLTAALFSKKQWTGLEGSPFIGGLNLTGPLGNNHALGGTVLFDRIGVDRFVGVNINYAYKIRISRGSYLSLGMNAAMNTLQSDYSQLSTIDAGDPLFMSSSPTFAVPNFGAGAYFFTRNFYIGFSAPSLLENKITISGADYNASTLFRAAAIHYYAHAGYRRRLTEKFDMNASVLIKQATAAPMQFDLNAQLVYNQRFGFGLSYRTSNEILALFNVDIIPPLKFGYAYEFNFGMIGRASAGSHEVMLIYKFNPPAKPIVAVPRF